MKNKLILLSLASLLLLSACKTTKSIVKHEDKQVNPVLSVIAQLQKNQPTYRTANVKMSLALNLNERKFNVTATSKMRKDSAMFVSFQVFGFEVFKAELMPDSIKVLDKMNSRFYVADYAYFSKRFGVNVDFYSLQSLLSAQFFCVEHKQVQPDSCVLVSNANAPKSIDYKTTTMLQSTQFSDQNIIQRVLLTAISSNYQLQTTYADYTVLSGINFPQKIELKASNQKMSASCDFSILKAEFNTNLQFQPAATSRYTRGDINQILKK